MNREELCNEDRLAEWHRREQESAVRAALPCPHCGSHEGLDQVYAPDLYDWVEEPETFPLPAQGLYQGQADDEVYTPCPVCNPDERIPSDVYPITGIALQHWVLARYPDPIVMSNLAYWRGTIAHKLWHWQQQARDFQAAYGTVSRWLYRQVSHWQRQQRLVNGQPLIPARLSE